MAERPISRERQQRSFSLAPPGSEVLNIISQNVEPCDVKNQETQEFIYGMLRVANGEQSDVNR